MKITDLQEFRAYPRIVYQECYCKFNSIDKSIHVFFNKKGSGEVVCNYDPINDWYCIDYLTFKTYSL